MTSTATIIPSLRKFSGVISFPYGSPVLSRTAPSSSSDILSAVVLELDNDLDDVVVGVDLDVFVVVDDVVVGVDLDVFVVVDDVVVDLIAVCFYDVIVDDVDCIAR